MIGSIFHPPADIAEILNDQKNPVDNFHLFQIIFMKVLVVGMLIILPLLLKADTVCLMLMIAIALEFWVNKNMAKHFLKAYWFVDTTTQKDRWVYQAQVKKPDAFEGLFWYSSLIYMVLLLLCFLYYASRHQLSICCSIFIGLICAYLNFFAYSKIIKTRNNGTLQNIMVQVDGSHVQNKATIQLPLITVRSQLKQISQEQQFMHNS